MSGTNLYILLLAGTGFGKERPVSAVATLLKAAGLGSRLGGQIADTAQGVRTALHSSPVCLLKHSEFGNYLSAISGKKAGSANVSVKIVVRDLHGLCFDTLDRIQMAYREYPAVHSPALSILGASNPKEFYKSIGSTDASGGFLNRFLLFSTDHREKQAELMSAKDVPRDIADNLRKIADCGSDQNALRLATTHIEGPGEPIIVVPYAGAREKEFYKAVCAFEELRMQREGGDMWVRVAENTLRLATVRAISNWEFDLNKPPKIHLSELKWAFEIACWSCARLALEVGEYLAESQTEELSQLIRRVVRKGGAKHGPGIITHTELSLAIKGKFRDERHRDGAIKLLEDAGEIEKRPMNTGGRTATNYVWRG